MKRMKSLVKIKGATLGIAGLFQTMPMRNALQYDPNDCANPCYVPLPPQPQPQGPRIFMQGFWDAMDCDDCDTVYNEKNKRSDRYARQSNRCRVEKIQKGNS